MDGTTSTNTVHLHDDRDTCRALADQHRPEFNELHQSGMGIDAIAVLYMARDMLHEGRGPWATAYGIIDAHRLEPFTIADVYPDGPPCRCDTWGLAACLVHRDFDPDDAQLNSIVWAHRSRGLAS